MGQLEAAVRTSSSPSTSATQSNQCVLKWVGSGVHNRQQFGLNDKNLIIF